MIQSKSEKIKVLHQDTKNIYITNFSDEESDSQMNNCQQKKPGQDSSKKYIHLKKQSSFEYKIGNYLIEKTLGEGTFGKVKLGTCLINKEKCAIKILEKSRMTDKDDLTRVKREFDMLIKFNHPNVILVMEIFENISSYYSVMEYCEGGELFNYIVEKKRISENEASFFYYQLINGLEYIHSLGVVHRDLKPENILLTKDHLLKIIDFGLSNYFIKGQKLLSTPCGSPCYASPEMVAGKEYDGVKIDIWSTGIILYAMICGYLPFEDKNHDILFEKILKCKVEYPQFLSNEVKDLLKKILVVDPKKRIDIPEIKKHSFFLKGKNYFEQIFSIKQVFYDENNQLIERDINYQKTRNKEPANDTEVNKEKMYNSIYNNKSENKNNIDIKNENKQENNKQSLDKDKIGNINNSKNPDNITGENIKNKKNEVNDLKKLKKDKIEQKINKYNKKIKMDKKKKIDITDNHYVAFNSSVTKDNNNKIIQKSPEIKLEKGKQKDLIQDKRQIMEIIEKDRMAMKSLESLNPSIEQNYRNLKHQINITNLMVNNINYNVNISFEDSKRTYSHEITKYNMQNNDNHFKSSTTNTSPNYKNTKKTTSKNSSNIFIIDNNMTNNPNKTVLGNNFLYKYYNNYNKDIKKGGLNLFKIKEKSRHKRIGGNAYIDSNKFRLFMNKTLANKEKKKHISKKLVDINSNLTDKANNNIMIIENDSKNYKSYKNNTINSYSESNSKSKDSNLYSNNTNYINIYKTIVNTKENKAIDEYKNKKFKKINIKNNIKAKENSLRNSQYYIALNSNSKKALSKKQFNLINKNVINNIKKINKFQFNKLLNLYSMDIETTPKISEKEKNTKGDFMNIVKTQGANEKSYNQKLNPRIKYSLNTLRKGQTNNFYQSTISSNKSLKNKQQLINNFYYNQLNNSCSQKTKFDTINFIHNFRIVKPALFLNKKIHKNISRQTPKPISFVKKDISSNLTEKALKSIDNDKEPKSKRNNKKINTKTIDINLLTDRTNTLSNYLKIPDKVKNQHKIMIDKSHKSNSKNKNKKDESKNSRNQILMISSESDKDFDQNRIKKMNKFRKICLVKKNDNKNDIKNSQNSMKKFQIKTDKKHFNINRNKQRPYIIRKNKTENNLGIIQYIPLFNIQTHQKKVNTFHSYSKNKIKYNNGKLTDIYRNTIKKRNKLKKVYLIKSNNNKMKDRKNFSDAESSNNVFKNKVNE